MTLNKSFVMTKSAWQLQLTILHRFTWFYLQLYRHLTQLQDLTKLEPENLLSTEATRDVVPHLCFNIPGQNWIFSPYA